MTAQPVTKIHFSDYFRVDPVKIGALGAFNVSLINDLPLFIDPFLLFNSKKPQYQNLHRQIITYLSFLRKKAPYLKANPALVAAWYTFPEFKQTWLGYSDTGNRGRGLGTEFATALRTNLNTIFSTFGKEKVTRGSHLEKLTLISDGVGKDKISDFTTNLIKPYLLDFTQKFALANLPKSLISDFPVKKVSFNYRTETWETKSYRLPVFEGNFVVLTPKDMLTKDDTWINKTDFIADFGAIVESLPNDQLRAQLNNFLLKVLARDASTQEKRAAAANAIVRFPEVVEYYILYKEERGDRARSISEKKVAWSERIFVSQVRDLSASLFQHTRFYELVGDTYEEAKARLGFLKDVIENKGGWRIFYVNGDPLTSEKDLHILYRLTWFATSSDVSREVDDGRGPADFKISRGSQDKTIVKFKLASNSRLRQNLETQAEKYKEASDAHHALKAVLYFTETELERVTTILKDLGLLGSPDICLIDARSDNKPSASKA